MYLKSQWLQVSIGIQQLPNACNITETSVYSVTKNMILDSVGVLYLEAAMGTVKRLQHVFYSKCFFEMCSSGRFKPVTLLGIFSFF